MFGVNYDYTSDEQYDIAKFLQWDSDAEVFDVIPSAFIHKLRKLSVTGSYTVTIEEDAPDAITKKIWGSEHVYALLLLYNGLNSPFGLTPGTVLYYPAWADVEKLFLQMRLKS